jgi:hypothetical protein
MKYPDQYATTAKSESIRVGDLVWWNEGVYVGYIVEVLEQNEQYEVWGLDEPGVVLTNLHPFEANKRKRQRCPGFIATGGTVVYPAKSLEDEGVGLLSSHERAEMDWAVATAQSKLARGLSHLDFCVSAVMNAGSHGEDWRIDFVDEDRQVIETFVVPFRPDTREKEVKRIQTNQSTLLTDMLGTLDMDVFGSTDPRNMPKHLFGARRTLNTPQLYELTLRNRTSVSVLDIGMLKQILSALSVDKNLPGRWMSSGSGLKSTTFGLMPVRTIARIASQLKNV